MKTVMASNSSPKSRSLFHIIVNMLQVINIIVIIIVVVVVLVVVVMVVVVARNRHCSLLGFAVKTIIYGMYKRK
jgi:hypothetical protein